jgi:hemoglobin
MTSIYEQIGGKDAVKLAVDIFYKKVLSDTRIKHFFNTVDMEKQKKHQTLFLSYAFGGIPHYDGKNMREAHKHLSLTEEHFQAVAECLQATLNDLNVPEELQNKVMAIAASTHDDVLNV